MQDLQSSLYMRLIHTGHIQYPGRRSGGIDHLLRAALLHPLHCGLLPQTDSDAADLQTPQQIVPIAHQVFLKRGGSGGVQVAAKLLRLLPQLHLMSCLGREHCSRNAGWPSADDQDLPGVFRFGDLKMGVLLMRDIGVNGAPEVLA